MAKCDAFAVFQRQFQEHIQLSAGGGCYCISPSFYIQSRLVTFRLNLAHVFEFITAIRLQAGYLACG